MVDPFAIAASTASRSRAATPSMTATSAPRSVALWHTSLMGRQIAYSGAVTEEALTEIMVSVAEGPVTHQELTEYLIAAFIGFLSASGNQARRLP
jgi:hypothetical protein